MTARRSLHAAVALVGALVGAGCSSEDGGVENSGAGDGGAQELVGTFRLDAGGCEGGEATGSYFRMVQPGGTLDAGPFVDNVDSPCADVSFTPLGPGTDGGLRTGSYQTQPDPAFGDGGSSAASAIIRPQPFFAVAFGISTNATDPQTGVAVPAPSVRAEEGDDSLAGDLSAFSVSWNGQHFNQGAPKPGADGPGVTGTFDADSGAYTLDWSSLIEGGAFNGFTGMWHLEGTFEPA